MYKYIDIQDTSSSIYTSIIPVSDMTPLSGADSLYDPIDGTILPDSYFYIMPSIINSNTVCIASQPADNDCNVSLFNTTTQSVVSSITLSGDTYPLFNHSQQPSLIENGSKTYCILEGYNNLNITDFSSNTTIPNAMVLSVYGNNVNYTNRSSSTFNISSINVETKNITDLSWINVVHNESSMPVMMYETVDNYVTINPTTFEVVCINKINQSITSSFNISNLPGIPPCLVILH